ncbi:hypothetical protein DSECCO2_416000 [anaerobic digester metagenome]
MQRKIVFSFFVIALLMLTSCGGNKQNTADDKDSVQTETVDSVVSDSVINDSGKQVSGPENNGAIIPETPSVTVMLFHATRKCASCIAITDCVNAVLKESFSAETKTKKVRLNEINADDEKNEAICEKYEAFGTALFVTRTFKGKESITDMTAQAFKLAKGKPEEFKKLLRDQIQKDLK